MLAGLLRIHLRGGMSGLGHLLWKQVGWWWFPLVGCSQLTNVTSLKGIIWILLAVAVGVPATVRLCTLFVPQEAFPLIAISCYRYSSF